ncbi:hypothetical protein ACVIQT_008942 [Bradyrhizobium diazoefficiens]
MSALRSASLASVAEYAVGEPLEAERHVERVGDREPGHALELLQVGHGRAAVEAHVHALVAHVPGVAGGAGQPDLVFLAAAGRGIDDARHPREADRQAVDILDLRPIGRQALRLRRVVDIGVAEAPQRGCVGLDGLRALDEAEALEIGAVLHHAGA